MKNLAISLYVLFLSIFTIFSYAFLDPNITDLKKIFTDYAFDQRALTTVFYIVSVVIFFIFYGIFVWLGIRKKIDIKDVIKLIGITFAVLFFSYPVMLSYDILNYIATSKVLFFYQENPYIIMPIEFAGDSLFSFMHAANKVVLYGPFWVLATGVPYFLGFGSLLLTLFSFKLFISFFYLGTVFLIWKMSKNIIPIILFSLNPLVVIESLVSSHNDIVMMFLTLLSFFLLTKKKVFLAIIFFILSILIKYTTILLLPVFLYSLLRIVRKKEINWKNIFYFSSILMYIAFLLSPIREEIYPWYAIWFLLFVFLVPEKKILLYVSFLLSFGLLFRYVPYMFSGTHGGLTPIFKSIVTFGSASLILLYFSYKKLWEKISSR